MRILLMKKAAGYVATVSLVACPFISSLTIAMPSQGGAYTTTSTTNPALVKPEKNSVLARNTTTATAPAPTATTAKVQKQQDKKTISRCWQRLMNMAREIRHAHSNKSK